MGCDGKFPVSLFDFELSGRGRYAQGIVVRSVCYHLDAEDVGYQGCCSVLQKKSKVC